MFFVLPSPRNEEGSHEHRCTTHRTDHRSVAGPGLGPRRPSSPPGAGRSSSTPAAPTGSTAAAAELAQHTTVVAIPGDVADPAHRAALVDAVRDVGPARPARQQREHAWAASPLPALDVIDLDVFRQVYEVNVVAPLALTQQLLPALVASHGTIVNVTSDAAVEAYEGWGGYGSSKAALEQLSAVLAAEQPDVRVLVVDPGDMRTEMHQDAFPGEDISDRPLPAAVVPGAGRADRVGSARVAGTASPEVVS